MTSNILTGKIHPYVPQYDYQKLLVKECTICNPKKEGWSNQEKSTQGGYPDASAGSDICKQPKMKNNLKILKYSPVQTIGGKTVF